MQYLAALFAEGQAEAGAGRNVRMSCTSDFCASPKSRALACTHSLRETAFVKVFNSGLFVLVFVSS